MLLTGVRVRGYLQECGQLRCTCIAKKYSLGWMLTHEPSSHELIFIAGCSRFWESLYPIICISYIIILGEEEPVNLTNSENFLKVIIVCFMSLSSLPLGWGVSIQQILKEHSPALLLRNPVWFPYCLCLSVRSYKLILPASLLLFHTFILLLLLWYIDIDR